MNRNNFIMIAGLLLLTSANIEANSSEKVSIAGEFQKLKYSYAFALSDNKSQLFNQTEFESTENNSAANIKSGHKSPAKAFLMSLAVPGLGQFYYGSKVKTAAFVGVEALAWLLHINAHSDAEGLTSNFEQFNRDHWSQARYEEYLFIVYGQTDDDSISQTEVSHHLPDTRTQQYYEMSGKYDQFSWGWDDADLNGQVYADWGTSPPTAVVGNSTAPVSARRLLYETMRFNANEKFDKATKMLTIVFANHLISAVEAFISTKKRNKGSSFDPEFSRLKIETNIKSIYSWKDTPYVNFGYKF